MTKNQSKGRFRGLGLIAGALFFIFPQLGSAESAVEIMSKNFLVTKVTDSESQSTWILTNKSGKERVRQTFGTTKLKKMA